VQQWLVNLCPTIHIERDEKTDQAQTHGQLISPHLSSTSPYVKRSFRVTFFTIVIVQPVESLPSYDPGELFSNNKLQTPYTAAFC
jgi:hypothetical protein